MKYAFTTPVNTRGDKVLLRLAPENPLCETALRAYAEIEIGWRPCGHNFRAYGVWALPIFRGRNESARIQLRMTAYNVFNKRNLSPFTFGSNSTVVS